MRLWHLGALNLDCVKTTLAGTGSLVCHGTHDEPKTKLDVLSW